MAGRKIKLKDQLGRVVRVPTATVAPAPTTPPVTQQEPARPAATVWKLIREIPANIQKLAKLLGTGFTTRGPDGEWFQRQIEAGEGIDVADGDGVAGNPTIGLAELANAGGGTLQKTLRDDYGRLAGTSVATTSDLAEGDNLYFTDARADARASAAVAAHVAAADPHPQYTTGHELTTALADYLRHDGTTEYSGLVLRYSGTLLNIVANTAAGSDTGRTAVCGGGGLGVSRGGYVVGYGNNHPTIPGQINFFAGSGFDAVANAAAFRPAGNNVTSLGSASFRWSVVYAATGTINTSDAREKTAVRPLTASELAAAAELGSAVGAYQWLAMVEAKGEAARQHIGMTVQRAIEVMESHGLDPFARGFICYDEWGELPEVVEERRLGRCVLLEDPSVTIYENVEESMADNADGDPPLLWIYEQTERIVSQEYRPAGDRYSFRMDELLAFIIAGERAARQAGEDAMAAKIEDLLQRLAAAGL